ncbi:Uncharacterised protein [Chlamydia abortus]|nr:Uncharacterised protein [Chlamydia abortus]
MITTLIYLALALLSESTKISKSIKLSLTGFDVLQIINTFLFLTVIEELNILSPSAKTILFAGTISRFKTFPICSDNSFELSKPNITTSLVTLVDIFTSFKNLELIYSYILLYLKNNVF